MVTATKPLDARALARALSTKDRTITDKMVRGRARDIIARFDKIKHPAYQAHLYTVAEQRVLRESFYPTKRATKPRVTKPRASATVTPDAS